MPKGKTTLTALQRAAMPLQKRKRVLDKRVGALRSKLGPLEAELEEIDDALAALEAQRRPAAPNQPSGADVARGADAARTQPPPAPAGNGAKPAPATVVATFMELMDWAAEHKGKPVVRGAGSGNYYLEGKLVSKRQLVDTVNVWRGHKGLSLFVGQALQ